MIYANLDGHQACDEPWARKRCCRTDRERPRAHTTPLHLDFGRATPTDRRLSCLTTFLLCWLLLFFLLPYMLCMLKDRSTEHVRTSMACARVLWVPRCGDGVPRTRHSSPRSTPSTAPAIALFPHHCSLLLVIYLRRLPDVLYPLPYFRSDHFI